MDKSECKIVDKLHLPKIAGITPVRVDNYCVLLCNRCKEVTWKGKLKTETNKLTEVRHIGPRLTTLEMRVICKRHKCKKGKK